MPCTVQVLTCKLQASFWALHESNASVEMVLASIDLLSSTGWRSLAQNLYAQLLGQDKEDLRFQKGINMVRLRFLRFLLNKNSELPTSADKASCEHICEAILQAKPSTTCLSET